MRIRTPQTIVYWAPTGADSFGRPSVATPVELKARWEDGMVETIDAMGTNVSASAKVYLTDEVDVGGILMLASLDDLSGDVLTSPKSDKRAHEVISKTSIPNLKASQSLVTAFLK